MGGKHTGLLHLRIDQYTLQTIPAELRRIRPVLKSHITLTFILTLGTLIVSFGNSYLRENKRS